MSSSTNDHIAEHGWTAVPVDAEAIFKGKPYLHKPTPVLAKDIHFPSDDPIVAKAQQYAKEHLPEQTYNHTMRVFYWATTILHQQFPSSPRLSPSTLALTSLLHDIGTAPEFLHSTLLSFEFHGAITALHLLSSPAYGAPAPQAEAVCEAIIRHQDLGTQGTIPFLGQIIQLATVYDNLGARPFLVHETTRADVNRVFPRGGWAGCFAKTIRDEVGAKPWAHSTHLGGPSGEAFVNAVEGNLLMAEYENIFLS
ncbi:hypothetical protein C8A00DRAFT_44029 [Chaetomidium leptoderma]|uniref:HD domain-containing protein n=1 Tax=Chaetomidium leptoderma TaxID=669021 RepID=A0AAN6VKL5_9PEZI|nr:hypothetical protein C8A00DRAFT_44029 [Chaetomidium leptoderma]